LPGSAGAEGAEKEKDKAEEKGAEEEEEDGEKEEEEKEKKKQKKEETERKVEEAAERATGLKRKEESETKGRAPKKVGTLVPSEGRLSDAHSRQAFTEQPAASGAASIQDMARTLAPMVARTDSQVPPASVAVPVQAGAVRNAALSS